MAEPRPASSDRSEKGVTVNVGLGILVKASLRVTGRLTPQRGSW
jgi:hypothetical protein